MIFHENCLLADNSHVVSYLIFSENWDFFLPNLSSAAVVISTFCLQGHLLITIENNIDADEAQHSDLDSPMVFLQMTKSIQYDPAINRKEFKMCFLSIALNATKQT